MNNINLKESEIIEFKKSIGEINEIGKTIVSFANTFGGEVYVNVKDDGELQKNKVTDNTLKKITDLNPSFDPKMTALFNFETVDIQGFEIIKITVIKSEYNIHTFQSVCYLRQGTTDQKITTEEMGKRYNKIKKIDWSAIFIANTHVSEVSKKAVNFLKDKLSKIKNDKKYLDFNIEELLKKLGLCNDRLELSRTALLFLCDYEYAIKFLDKDICYFTWKYKDDANSIEQRAEPFTTPFILSIYEIQDYINRFNTTLQDLNLFREDTLQYDTKSIEELLINSFAHRDWSINLWNEIKQTPKQLEIRNPGKFNADIEQVLKYNNIGNYRNPAMCDFLKRVNLMEREREGLQKVFEVQYKKGLRTKYNFLENRTDFILSGKIENENFAKLVLKYTEMNLLELLVLDKISEGKNILDVDISEEEFLLVSKYITKHHKSNIIKINSELLMNIDKFDSAFLASHTSGKTKEEVFLDFAKKNGFITTKNAYNLFPEESENTVRSIIKRLKDCNRIKMLKKGEYVICSNTTVIKSNNGNATGIKRKILENQDKTMQQLSNQITGVQQKNKIL